MTECPDTKLCPCAGTLPRAMDVADARPRSLPLHQLLDHALARQLEHDRRGRAYGHLGPAQQRATTTTTTNATTRLPNC